MIWRSLCTLTAIPSCAWLRHITVVLSRNDYIWRGRRKLLALGFAEEAQTGAPFGGI